MPRMMTEPLASAPPPPFANHLSYSTRVVSPDSMKEVGIAGRRTSELTSIAGTTPRRGAAEAAPVCCRPRLRLFWLLLNDDSYLITFLHSQACVRSGGCAPPKRLRSAQLAVPPKAALPPRIMRCPGSRPVACGASDPVPFPAVPRIPSHSLLHIEPSELGVSHRA